MGSGRGLESGPTFLRREERAQWLSESGGAGEAQGTGLDGHDVTGRGRGRVADLAVHVHGGSGYMREVRVERIYRDVRLLRLYEGTSEIQRLIIGGSLVRSKAA